MVPEIEPEATSHELAAVLFTDAESFSAHMHEREAEALEAINSDLDCLKYLATEHHGQVLKGLGDGLLVRFKSASDAVKCAIAFQKAMATGYGPDNHRTFLRHRVGVHLGDMYVSDTEVMGDGVNIASRLQTIAKPGGICISQTVYDIVKNKVELKAIQLGPRQLKNIAMTIPVYRILVDAVGDETGEKKGRAKKTGNFFKNKERLIITLSASGVTLLLCCLVAFLLFRQPKGDYSNRGILGATAKRVEVNGPIPIIKLTDRQVTNEIVGREIFMGQILGIDVIRPIKAEDIKNLEMKDLQTDISNDQILYYATFSMSYEVRTKYYNYTVFLTYDQTRYVHDVSIKSPFNKK
ncbi:MAG: adenylate/guanylate cyclase domain-containing protein [Verrucomicrobiota bacterium]